jgi:hypothetical protein
MGMTTEFKHPADEIARALARASGILTVISGCYDKNSSQFAIGTTYLAESISAVEGLLNAANTALGRLYETCDLTILENALPQTEAAAPALAEAEVLPMTQAAAPIAEPTVLKGAEVFKPAAKTSYLAAFGPSEASTSLGDRVDSAVPAFKSAKPLAREAVLEKPATTYDELLAKITAVADQAAFQAHTSPSDRSLVPVLEGLRADLMKMRSVA